MHVQIRNPIAVEVKSAGEDGGVSIQFFTAAEHQAAVILNEELIAELIEQLKAYAEAEVETEEVEEEPQPMQRNDYAPAEKPQPVKRKQYFAVEQKLVRTAEQRAVRVKEPMPAEQPILRALLQA
jgi:hypothetical protein